MANELVPMTGEAFAMLVASKKTEISKLSGHGMSDEHFKSALVAAARKNDLILKCTPDSIWNAARDCAGIQLIPNTPAGEAYLIPYWNSRGGPKDNSGKARGAYELQFQIGRSGWVKLAMRSGNVADVGAQCVRKGEHFKCDPRRRVLEHELSMDVDGTEELVAAYAWLTWLDGREGPVQLLRRFEALKIREQVRGRLKERFQYTPWVTHEDRMWERSALVRLIRTRLAHNEQIQMAFLHESESLVSTPDNLGGDLDAADVAPRPEAPTPEQRVEADPKKRAPRNVTPQTQPEEPPPFEPDEFPEGERVMKPSDVVEQSRQAGLSVADMAKKLKAEFGVENAKDLNADQCKAYIFSLAPS